ncbi:MAG TPA: hypothetical protein PLE64_08255 [Spirochaetota bacterium]|nr:hypothetical protein [Spirochaetota bacterium]
MSKSNLIGFNVFSIDNFSRETQQYVYVFAEMVAKSFAQHGVMRFVAAFLGLRAQNMKTGAPAQGHPGHVAHVRDVVQHFLALFFNNSQPLKIKDSHTLIDRGDYADIISIHHSQKGEDYETAWII